MAKISLKAAIQTREPKRGLSGHIDRSEPEGQTRRRHA
jgi:hypothetical protein